MLLLANIFQPLIAVFETVLKAFHSAGVSWGFSIILLTVAVRAVLIPLTIKQLGSMQRLQQLQPELKALQAKYKDDKERQQQEMMRFYRENKVNPAASCLPMVAQIPVFISLFYMLRQSLRVDICPERQVHHIVNGLSVIDTAHLRPCGVGHGAGFLFVGDLTNKATGVTLIVLLLLYVGSQVGSSLMMSSATMDKNMRMIMLVMPLFFVFIFLRYPAGLLVYWITTNFWTMGQQYVIRRRMGPVTAAASPAAAGGSAGPAPTGGRAGSKRAAGANGADPGAANGAEGGGLGARLLALAGQRQEKAAEPAKVGAPQPRGGRPPAPPRKKKKRSGRRR